MILKSRGYGKGRNFKKIGKNVVIEDTALIFEPEHIEIGNNVYIGHQTMLHGYYKNEFKIGSNVFISAGCNIYGAGGVEIQDNVGIGPGVLILGSPHDLTKDNGGPINQLPMRFDPIVIKEGSDIGAGAIIIGGAVVGKGSQVGAGAMVKKKYDDYLVIAGVPAKLLRSRK